MARKRSTFGWWSGLQNAGRDGVHWTDVVLVAAICVVPLVAAYKIWQNAEALLRTFVVIVLLGAFVRGRARDEAKQFIDNFRTPFGILALVAIAYVLVSSLWASPVLGPDMKYLYPTVGALRSFWLVLAAAIVASRLADVPSERVHRWLAAATALGLALLLVEISANFPITRRVAHTVEDGQVNPNVIALSLLAWPAIGTLVVQNRKLAALALWVLTGLVVAIGHSGAAVLGYAVGSATVALAWLSMPLAIWSGTIAAVGGLLLAPFFGTAASALMEFLPARLLSGAHPLERIEIWQHHAASIYQAPVFGIGFRGLGGEHPHNAALQIWLDFGAVGVMLATGLIALTGAALLRSTSMRRPFVLACATAIYANAYVSLGMWEGQWLAIELLVAVFAIHGLNESRDLPRSRKAR